MGDRFRALGELAREFSAALDDYDALLSLVARRVGETFGDLCVIRLVGADGFFDPVVAMHHPDTNVLAVARAAISTHAQRIGEGISGRVAETGVPLFVPVVEAGDLVAQQHADRRAFVGQMNITSLIVVPLLARGKTIGVASLTRSDATRPYDASDLGFLEHIATHAALAIENARVHATGRATAEANRLLFEASPVPLFVFDVETLHPLAVNPLALELYGYERDEFMKLRVTDLAAEGHETARARLAAWRDAETLGTTQYVRKDGARLVAEYTTRALTFAGREARVVAVKDVTERHALDQTRALLAAIIQSSNDAIVSKQLDGTITSWNGAAERLFGYAAAEVIGNSITMIVPPERRDEERALLARVSAGERVDHYETVRVRKDGSLVDVSISVSPILDASGKVIGASKTARDLTAQRKAERTLRNTEEQLRQSQKMDAIGKLAGGVAHDFNNVLSVILSYSDVLVAEIDANDPMRADLLEIRNAGARAADLTHQLLAFGRQQVMQPRVLDLNEVLGRVEKMLRRLIGEDIELTVVRSDGLRKIHVDPTQVEQVILNLVVNARDAMPRGGRMTIETANVVLDAAYASTHHEIQPGAFVMIAVTDTGTGIDEATQSRMFEPFFTTKERGQGTGLGLATVFGIVQQSGGSIWVYSEVGKGTTFKIYFPRAREESSDVPAPPRVAPQKSRGFETVLLVDDDASVRTVALMILKRHGYHVLEAQSGGEALLIAEKHTAKIDLLLTDVIMPRMSGRELAERVCKLRPEMRVLYMSGYTANAIVHHGVLDSGIALIQKPITPDTLAGKVREVLDAPRATLRDQS